MIKNWVFWVTVIGIQAIILVWGAGKLNEFILQPLTKILTF